MITNNFEELKLLHKESIKLHRVITNEQALEIVKSASARRQGAVTIFNSLVVVENTGISVRYLRQAARHFYLDDTLAGQRHDFSNVLSALAAHIPSHIQSDGTPIPSGPVTDETEAKPRVPAFLKSLSHKEAWVQAILIARAHAVLGKYIFSDLRTETVGEAAIAMKKRGYKFKVANGQIDISKGKITKIIRDIEAKLAGLDAEYVLRKIFLLATKFHKLEYGQILFGRHHTPRLERRDPLPPIGLLFNLAVKLPFFFNNKENLERLWTKAVDLARDFCALLDLESYTSFDNMSVDATLFENTLRKMALYDHLFCLRQWRYEFTTYFLEKFFTRSYDSELKKTLGWNIDDLISFISILDRFAKKEPYLFAKSDLYSKGLPDEVVNAILRDASYCQGEANSGYTSPFVATGQDVMFRPLLLIPEQEGANVFSFSRGLLGPAFYEVAFSAIKKVVPSEISNIRGTGTERLTKDIFAKYGFNVSIEDKEYKMDGVEGECDLVFQDKDHIILVECKAKSLTRGAMSGVEGDAMLDFAANLMASQAQSLRHERILRTQGHISFTDGTVLEWKDRKITRLSISLSDQGQLQDRWFLETCVHVLINASVTCDPTYSKKKQIDNFNKSLNLFQNETKILISSGGDVRTTVLNIGSASLAQLDIILEEAKSLGDVVDFMAVRASYSTGNPLLEHFHLERLRQHGKDHSQSTQ